jgi:hypothetical protein
MADDSALITKPRDYSDIAKLQEPGVLEEFFDKPLPFIVATVIGALAAGKAGWLLAGGRIVQGMLKGKLFQQFSQEVKKLQEAGKIEDNFAETKYGGQTWVELMRIIDEESPDPDRLGALRAMFFAVNKVGTTDGEKIKAYQLWQIAKSLNSGELLLLRTVYEHMADYVQTVDKNIFSAGSDAAYLNWASYMANAVGHGSIGLIQIHEKQPIELGLLSGSSDILLTSARLTNLGKMFCANIENYEIEVRGEGNAE